MSDPVAGNWITYNGEIYNFLELRGDLEKRGHRFVSRCDTEVILKAYAEWGVGCWRRLRGIFAFGLWDERYHELHLVRDHMGVKPLYFAYENNSLVFASEVRALLDAGLNRRKLSVDGLWSYLKYGSVQEPVTLVQGVESVEPGHFLTCDAHGRKIQHHYWRLGECINRNWATQPSSDEVSAALRDSVKRQLVSDVPLGVFLSGGVDSSAIAALAVHAGYGQVKTFCIGTDDKNSDESAEAKATSAWLGTEHTTLVLQANIVAANFGNALNSYDQPSIDGLNTYFVSKLVRDAGISVALSGLGGDEVFLGYGGFEKAMRMARLGRQLAWIPTALRKQLGVAVDCFSTLGRSTPTALSELLRSKSSSYYCSRTLFSSCSGESLLSSGFPGRSAASAWGKRESELVKGGEALSDINRISFLEIQTYMMSTLLRDADQMSMAHGLELRVPLIDHQLIEHVLPLLDSEKLVGNQSKSLLIRAMGTAIPPFIAARAKRGFSLPLHRWILGELYPVFDDHFNSAVLRGPWDRAVYRNVWNDFLSGRVSWSRILSLYSLEHWMQRNKIDV